MLPVILILVIALPVAWCCSEFQNRVWIRILLGVLSLTMSFGVAFAVGSFERFNSNAWYGSASGDLITATVMKLEEGETEEVIEELKALRSRFHPTYESRANYHEHVRDYTEAIGVTDEALQHQREL